MEMAIMLLYAVQILQKEKKQNKKTPRNFPGGSTAQPQLRVVKEQQYYCFKWSTIEIQDLSELCTERHVSRNTFSSTEKETETNA